MGMAWFLGKKEEKPVENKMPEQSERQYNLYWMIRMSPSPTTLTNRSRRPLRRRSRKSTGR